MCVLMVIWEGSQQKIDNSSKIAANEQTCKNKEGNLGKWLKLFKETMPLSFHQIYAC